MSTGHIYRTTIIKIDINTGEILNNIKDYRLIETKKTYEKIGNTIHITQKKFYEHRKYRQLELF